MSPEQKIQLRITAMQHASTLNQKYFTGAEKYPEALTEKVLEDAEKIYLFLLSDADVTSKIKTLSN